MREAQGALSPPFEDVAPAKRPRKAYTYLIAFIAAARRFNFGTKLVKFHPRGMVDSKRSCLKPPMNADGRGCWLHPSA